MNKKQNWRRRLPVLSAAALFGLGSALTAFAEPPEGRGYKSDDYPHPLGQQRRELRLKAQEAKLRGKAHGKTHEVARGQYVELERAGEESIFTILAEFNDLKHNSIPQPDRDVDNSTIWTADFSREHYLDLLFSEEPGAVSMRNFYIALSSNRYTVNGDVTDWVAVPGDAAFYDDDADPEEDGGGVWQLLEDSANGWYEAQLAAGQTPDSIDDYLSQFDVWDRYDHDGDGDFNEPDGYIDHFQSVHAGEGEEAGAPPTAIWSHRWYARYQGIGSDGPDFNPFGGIRIGDSNYWIGDYTIEPENGGAGVFSHEYAHDLGLPDLYATSGPENGTGFWTLMSSGSWGGDGTEDIGSRPIHMGAWEKFQLGWLNYEVAFAGSKSEHKLGPAETNTRQAQGLFVVLPDKAVTATISEPYAGEHFYYSGSGNNLDNFMSKAFVLPEGGSSLSAWVNFDIELDWDYAYLVVSTDGGATWETVETNHSTDTDPNGQNFGHGITGDSEGWVELTASLNAYSGEVLVGFRYWTDVAAVEPGFMVDEIVVAGGAPDGAETEEGWTLDGFSVTAGTETGYYSNYYVAEFRQYRDYDEGLQVGPYNFGFLDNEALGNWVEHFPYQDGLLISYWDNSESDNNTGPNDGSGLILPIDANPEAMRGAEDTVLRNRIQTYDATFGLEPTDAITLHFDSVPYDFPSLPASPVFDDRNSYWDPNNPTGSVITPNTGTQIRVKSISAKGGFMQVEVRPAR